MNPPAFGRSLSRDSLRSLPRVPAGFPPYSGRKTRRQRAAREAGPPPSLGRRPNSAALRQGAEKPRRPRGSAAPSEIRRSPAAAVRARTCFQAMFKTLFVVFRLIRAHRAPCGDRCAGHGLHSLVDVARAANVGMIVRGGIRIARRRLSRQLHDRPGHQSPKGAMYAVSLQSRMDVKSTNCAAGGYVLEFEPES